jgi:hypothetical protein
MVHRVVMTAGGRQFVMDGHLAVRADGSMRLVAMGQLGVIAEVSISAEGEIDVGQTHRRFPKRWARRYIARDMRLLFGTPPYDALRAGRLSGGVPVLETVSPGGAGTTRYSFSRPDNRWLAVETCGRGRQRCRATCSNWKTFAGWDAELPSEFAVDAGQYSLNITIADVQKLAR